MKSKSENIPVYSLHNFSSSEKDSQQFQVEVFDANRHFAVKYPHRHDFFEVLYLSKGSGFHVIDGNKYEIKPPCVFFMSPGQAHKIEFSSDIEGYIFIFTAEFYLINHSNQNRLIEFPFFTGNVKGSSKPFFSIGDALIIQSFPFISVLILGIVDTVDNWQIAWVIYFAISYLTSVIMHFIGYRFLIIYSRGRNDNYKLLLSGGVCAIG